MFYIIYLYFEINKYFEITVFQIIQNDNIKNFFLATIITMYIIC